MKRQILLWNKLADESASRCRTNATMDKNTVQVRSKAEGMSFLTISLPSFGKDFQKSLDQGIVGHNSFLGFKRRGGLPLFLGGFLDLVFDRDNGVLLDQPDIEAILAVRQLTLMFSKILLPCTPARERNAMSSYIQCEKEVKEVDRRFSDSDFSEFRRLSTLLFGNLFSELDLAVQNLELVPKHGPGATADKLRGNGKYRLRTWTDRLERYFPSGDYLFPNYSSFNEEYDDLHFLEPGEELPVKVISVPKTQKTPRIIAIEPTCMQYAQQAILERIVQGIREDFLLDSLIGFEHQEPNQLLARSGSKNGLTATLDLSEASDRVSNQHVRQLLHSWPNLLGAVDACRSRKADVPGHGVIRLAKFASMGSALCFPFEAMVFLTTTLLGIQQSLNTHLTKSDIKSLVGQVRIYGDDIIVPVDHVHSVIDSLEHFGAQVGTGKSFWIGRFRESCGKEYYDGYDVSIVKVRRVFPSSRRDVPEVISLVELSNQLFMAGYWQTVKWLDGIIGEMLIHHPVVLPSSSVLGKHSFLGFLTEREHPTLHAPLVKGYCIVSRLPRDKLDGPGALLKFFLKRGSLPSADEEHLERSGRPRAVDIKPRWASPF